MRERARWIMAALSAAAVVLAAFLIVGHFRAEPPYAFAQSEGVSANYVIALLGPKTEDQAQLFVIDTKAQTILVYEYIVSRRDLVLRVARSYKNDRDVEDRNFYNLSSPYVGPSVNDVQKVVVDQLRSRGGGR